MAFIQAQLGIDSLSVDLNFYSRHFYDDEFSNNTNFQYGGRTYEDAYFINGYDGSVDLVLAFLGYGIGFDSSGRANRGTVTALAEGTYSGQDIWYIQGISVSASRLNSVASTYSNADDRALIGSVLSGNDTIQLSAYDDRFEAWDGNDRMFGGGGNDTLFGGDGNDTIQGGVGNDTLNGGIGNDVYYTDGGDTIVEAANAGLDWVSSSANHTLAANVENLTLTGSAANGTGNGLANLIRGNTRANVLNGGTGSDTLEGGAGNDIYITDSGDVVREAAGGGTDMVRSTANHALAANVENLVLTGTVAINGTGNTLNNSLTGNAAANVLNGGAGNDTLNGGAGNDTLWGGGGADFIAGGAGADLMRGGAGDGALDTFVFNALTNSAVGPSRDIVEDFVSGIDRLGLSALDANAAVAGNQGFLFNATAARAHAVWYVGTAEGVVVRADVNGNTTADFEVLLRGVTSLTGNDFIL